MIISQILPLTWERAHFQRETSSGGHTPSPQGKAPEGDAGAHAGRAGSAGGAQTHGLEAGAGRALLRHREVLRQPARQVRGAHCNGREGPPGARWENGSRAGAAHPTSQHRWPPASPPALRPGGRTRGPGPARRHPPDSFSAGAGASAWLQPERGGWGRGGTHQKPENRQVPTSAAPHPARPPPTARAPRGAGRRGAPGPSALRPPPLLTRALG